MAFAIWFRAPRVTAATSCVKLCLCLMYGPIYIRYRHDFTHDVDHVRTSPRFRAGSKVIRVLNCGEGGRAWERGYATSLASRSHALAPRGLAHFSLAPQITYLARSRAFFISCSTAQNYILSEISVVDLFAATWLSWLFSLQPTSAGTQSSSCYS